MNLNLQPTIENELVLLRPIHDLDFEQLFQVAKDPLIWQQHSNKDRYKRDVFQMFFNESLASKGALLVIDKETNKVIGSTRFKRIDGAEGAIEIGWSFLSRKYWGGKYNKSFKTLMIDYAFNALEEIVFFIAEDNIRSQRAVEKIGGIRTTNSKYQYSNEAIKNVFTYVINKENWRTDKLETS